jgi:hypothetical protein
MSEADISMEEGWAFKFEDHYCLADHTLNLNSLRITDALLDQRFEDLLRFINENKVVSLSLDSNKFSPNPESFNEILKKVKVLLEQCSTLMSISLKNNFKQESVEKGLVLSPEIILALISSLGKFKNLFGSSSANTSPKNVIKQIFFGNDETAEYSATLPLTPWQRIKAYTGHFVVFAITAGATYGFNYLGTYLSGHNAEHNSGYSGSN